MSSDQQFSDRARALAIRRKSPDREKIAERDEVLSEREWHASCEYCGKDLTGTLDELMSHCCLEFRGRNEART